MAEEKKSVTMSFVTTPSIEMALRKAAVELDRSVSWIIGKALEDFLKREGSPQKPKSSAR